MDSFNSLSNLPNNALIHVLRTMEIQYLLGLSILSKRAKQLVMDLNLKTDQFSVTIKNIVSICVLLVGSDDEIYWLFYGNENQNQEEGVNNEQPPIKFPIPNSVLYIKYPFGSYKCQKEGFELKDWINHLLTVFHRSKIDHLKMEEGCERFDFESIHEVFNGCDNIYVDDVSRAYFNQILKKFEPPKSLKLSKNLFQNPKDICNIFIQNFNDLNLFYSNLPDWPQLGLDDLLIINSLQIIFYNSTLSSKVLNSFIKHWINGSNSRMNYFCMSFLRDVVLHEKRNI